MPSRKEKDGRVDQQQDNTLRGSFIASSSQTLTDDEIAVSEGKKIEQQRHEIFSTLFGRGYQSPGKDEFAAEENKKDIEASMMPTPSTSEQRQSDSEESHTDFTRTQIPLTGGGRALFGALATPPIVSNTGIDISSFFSTGEQQQHPESNKEEGRRKGGRTRGIFG